LGAVLGVHVRRRRYRSGGRSPEATA
jgi:hypothetical protein